MATKRRQAKGNKGVVYRVGHRVGRWTQWWAPGSGVLSGWVSGERSGKVFDERPVVRAYGEGAFVRVYYLTEETSKRKNAKRTR